MVVNVNILWDQDSKISPNILYYACCYDENWEFGLSVIHVLKTLKTGNVGMCLHTCLILYVLYACVHTRFNTRIIESVHTYLL